MRSFSMIRVLRAGRVVPGWGSAISAAPPAPPEIGFFTRYP
jgi:hypothetical protein